MKIFAISDLHMSVNNDKPMDIFGPTWENYLEKIIADWKEKVSDEDLVLLAGDFSWAMKLEEVQADFDMLSALPGKKVIIKGNHDFWWKSISAVRNILPQNFYALQNDAIKLGDVVICGSRFWNFPDENKENFEKDDKIFKRELLRIEMSLQAAQKLASEGDRIVCMLHYPPYTFKEEDTAVTALMEKYNVSKVVYGHIHAYCKQNMILNKNGIDYFLTSCDLLKNSLIEIK